MTLELWFEVLGRLGGIAGIVIAVAAATWQAFKFLSAKWIDNKFAEALKKVEQKHDVMVRRLQSEIDRELERANKLHGKEFDSLAEGWAILHEAYWRARHATSRAYQIHDLTQMGAQQLAEFIDNLEFPNWRKQELQDEQNPEHRQKKYLVAWRTKQYSDCHDWRTKLVMFVDRSGIYMQPAIMEKFNQLYILIDDALLELRLRIADLTAPVNPFNDFVRSDALKDGEAVYHDLEKFIHERLWSYIPE